MKQRILSLLVLLAAAVSGAWADELQTKYTSDAQLNAVTVSTSMEITIIGDAVVTINGGLVIEDNATLTVNGPGKLKVNGTNGSQGSQGSGYTGATGGQGSDGGAAITGNIVVKGATVEATGGAGGAGGRGGIGSYSPSGPGGKGGKGGKGAAAFTGAVTIFSGTIIAKGGKGGDGGEGGDGDQVGQQPNGEKGEGGDSGNPFAGTLTFYGGTVNAKGVSRGYGKPDGNIAKAFANDVTMKTTTYELRGSDSGNNSAIELAEIKNYTWVDIIAADYVEPTFDYAFTEVATDHGSGKIAFFIGDSNEEVKGANVEDEGKTVTMTITPDEGWVVDEANITAAQLFINWENASARRAPDADPTNVPMQANIALNFVKKENGVWTFTFTQPASSVRVSPKYLKISTLYFDPAGKTELMEVKVGDVVANPIQEGKITDVLEGTAVNLKANTGYKFRKVEVKKKPTTLTITDNSESISTTLDIAGCTTWDEVITKNSDQIKKNGSGNILDKNESYALYKGGTLVNASNEVAPNATDYLWVAGR